MIKKIFLLLMLSLIISCNFHIEKRRYFKGYHVEIKKANHPFVQKEDNIEIIPSNSVLLKNNHSEPLLLNSKGLGADDKSNTFSKNILKSHSKNVLSSLNENHSKQENSSVASPSSAKRESAKIINQKKKKSSWDDGYLFGLFTIMGLGIIGLAKKFKQIILRISDWATKNKLKSQILIGTIQTTLAILGIAIGKNFHDLGCDFSENSSYFFFGAIFLAISVLIKSKKASEFEPLKSFFKNKMAHGAIALSSIMLMTVVGNRIGTNNPTNSLIGFTIEKNHFGLIDKKNAAVNYIDSSDVLETSSAIDKTALISLYVFLGILMALVLMALTCAVWCWAVISGEVGVLVIAVVATICLILLAIYAISAMRSSIDDRFPPDVPK